MINFVLQQLGQIALFICVDFMPLTVQILIPHGDFTVPLDLHKNGKKTQTRIPHHYFFFAPFGDHRIHDWPGLLARQPQKNNSHVRANLRRRNPTPVSCCFSPISKSVRQILDQRANLRRSGIVNFLRHLSQSRVSQLQNSPYRHIRLSLSASLRSTLCLCLSLFPLLRVLCALCVEIPLRPFPPPRFPCPEDRLNHRHVRNRILKRHRNLAPLPNRPRQRIPLHRILVANRNRLRSNPPAKYISSIIYKNPRWPVVRRIKRNFNLDSSFRPQELHSLVVHQLRAARERRLPRRKLQNRRRQSVRLEIRIYLDQSRNPRRLLSKNKSRRRNRVTPDIHYSAPAPLRFVPHVLRIAVEIAERSHDRSQLSDHPFANQLARPQPLRVRLHHERLADLDPAALPHCQQRFCLRHCQAQRLLTQHMFPCLRRFH